MKSDMKCNSARCENHLTEKSSKFAELIRVYPDCANRELVPLLLTACASSWRRFGLQTWKGRWCIGFRMYFPVIVPNKNCDAHSFAFRRIYAKMLAGFEITLIKKE